MGIANTPPVGFVDARNYFEHFDERMDRFLASHEGLLIHRLIAGNVSDEIELDGGRRFRPKFLQLLNTNTLELSLYDQSVRLLDIVRGVELLQQSVATALDRVLPKAPSSDS